MARDHNIVPIKPGDAGATPFDPNRPSALPSPLMPIRKQAVDYFKSSLTTLFDNADDSLFEMADRAGSNTEQTLFFEAMRAVRLQRHRITKDCCHGIMRELEALADARPPVSVATLHSFELDTLSLVQPDELEETVALDSMIGRAVTRNKTALSHLSIRFNSLARKRVDERDIPIGPAVLSQIFVASLAELELDIKVRLIIFKLFERYVFNQLDGFYDETNRQLVLAGILPDLKTTAGRQAAARMTAGHGAAGQPAGAARSEDHLEHQQVLSMFSELIGNWRHASGDSALSPLGTAGAQPLRSHELLGLLAELANGEPAEAEQPLDMRAQINQLLRRQREHHGQPRALDRVDDDVISLVSMLFDFILDDPELPAAVKAMIGRLQLPILRVAIADKRFFSQSSHPARRLLNELARSTVGWSDQDDLRRDQLHALLESIVQRLLDQPDPTPELFAALHTELASFINVERRRADRLEQRTRDAEEGRARIEAARTQVAVSLNALLVGKTLPVFVVDLLRDTWSQVMQMTCLREGPESDAWRAVNVAAEQLLESVEPLGEDHRQGRERLNTVVRRALKEGFQLIGLRPEQGAPLLGRLQQLQQLQLTSVPEDSQPVPDPAATSLPTPERRSAPELRMAEPAAQYQPIESEPERIPTVTAMVDSPLPADTRTVSVVEPVLEIEQPDSEPELVGDLPDIKAAAWVGSLHTGSWFELTQASDEPAQRCKLAAIISFSGKYIFVNRNGMKVGEYSATALAQHYQQGLVRLLDDSQLFDRALESVIGNLRRLQASKN